MAANPQAYADRKRAAMERVAQMRAEREAVTKSCACARARVRVRQRLHPNARRSVE